MSDHQNQDAGVSTENLPVESLVSIAEGKALGKNHGRGAFVCEAA